MMRFLACVLMLLGATPGAAKTLHVEADGSGPYPRISIAISAAQPGDTILLGAGTYTGPNNTRLNFAGKDLVLMGSGPDATILDCEDQGHAVLYFGSGETRAAVLRDMTLRNNYNHLLSPGIRIEDASPTLANLRLVDFDGASGDDAENWYSGAAIHVDDGSPRIVDVEVNNCGGAGSISATGGAPEFERVLIDNGGIAYGNGGAISFAYCAATLLEVTITNSVSFGGGGGGISCTGEPSPSLKDCRFEGNIADSENGDGLGGGGLACFDGARPSLRRCAFIGNEARGGGGGLACYWGAEPLLEDVLFVDCESAAGGTAIYLESASAILRGVTITGGSLWDGYHDECIPSTVLCFNSSPVLERVLAFKGIGVGLWADVGSLPDLSCCDFCGFPDGNFGGSMADPTGSQGNIALDPLFCGGADPETAYLIGSGSPCAPANNVCGVLIGAFPPGCNLEAFSIEGTITDSKGTPLAGASIEGAGYGIHSNALGDYALVVPSGWSGTLYPTFPGLGFTPHDRGYTEIADNQVDQDFVGGRVTLRRVPQDLPTIQAALSLVFDGDTVLVAPGNYSGPGFRDLDLLGKDVCVIGEGGSAATVIDCESSGRAFNIHLGESPAALIQGFTLTNGYNDGSLPRGGGFYVGSSSPTLRDLVVENCWVRNWGGGIQLSQSLALLEDVVVRNCESSYYGIGDGGGIHCYRSAPTLRRVLLAGNLSDSDGGGLCCKQSSPILEQVTMVGNASGSGGGLACESTSLPVLSGCLIAGNTASKGGGIYCSDAASAPAVACSDVYANPGGNYGGLLPDQTGLNGNISEEPRLCDLPGGDYSLEASSPCLPGNNACAVQMGAYGEGCDLTAVVTDTTPAFGLAAPQPNPFNPKTTLRFALPRAAAVDLAIYDVSGRRVARLLAGEPLPAGHHAIDWEGRDEAGRALASGVYFARFAAGGFTAEHKLVLLR